jgi:alkylated DNA repair dioxygenase AlkB
MSQLDLFGDTESNGTDGTVKEGLNILENGEIIFHPSFFPRQESDSLFDNLRNHIAWRQESMNMYGRNVNFPRLTAWYGDNDKPYSFSGITLNPLDWTDELLAIKERIEAGSDIRYNSVLLNLYRDGNDSISWHTDGEKELGRNPVIASVNFGATRRFQLRHMRTGQKLEMDLLHGSLLIMQGELQHYWQHQVPKSKKVVGQRINLTFRVIK